ncbi:hypothetical protein [Bradyrhizobium niftali]
MTATLVLVRHQERRHTADCRETPTWALIQSAGPCVQVACA